MSVRTRQITLFVNLGMLEWIYINLLEIIPLAVRYLVKIHAILPFLKRSFSIIRVSPSVRTSVYPYETVRSFSQLTCLVQTFRDYSFCS